MFCGQLKNEPLCFVSSSVLAESFVLRNRQLLVAAKPPNEQIIPVNSIKKGS